MLQVSYERQVEQRGRRSEPLRRPRPKNLSRLVQHEEGAQLPLESDSARREPSGVVQIGETEQARELVGAVGEVDELAAGRHRDPLARRQVIDRRIERRALHRAVLRHEALAEHASLRIEANQGNLREPIDVSERFGERDQCRFYVRGSGERVGERSERARRHRVSGGGAAAGRQRKTRWQM